MTETVARGLMLLLAIVVFNNYRGGTLGDWFKAKFLNAAAPKPAAEGASSSSSPTFVPVGRDAAVQASGRFLHPTGGQGHTGSGGVFGAPRPGRTHAGLDLGVPIGTAVLAARGGRVIAVGPSGGYGLRVDIDHGGGFTTRYAHLSRADVRFGQDVLAGQRIALSGNTGRSTGPHLHFEIRVHGRPVNPAPLITTAPVAGADRAVVA